MANVTASIEQILPEAGASNAGRKMGYLSSTTKAAQNDTVTIGNAKEVVFADLQIVATGAAEPYTVSTNVITLTSATAGAVKGIIYYR